MKVVKLSRIAVAAGLAFFVSIGIVHECRAQERTFEELKTEAQARADRNAYPLIGLKPEEVREALGRLKSLDPDDWAASWTAIGDRYASKAHEEKSSPASADKDFIQAWLYYTMGRWPVPILSLIHI